MERHLRLRKTIALSFVIVFTTTTCFGQSVFNRTPEKAETRTGNKQFNKGDYADAEVSYKKALDKKNNMPEATFNLGDAVYQQKRYEEAAKQFQLSAQTNTDGTVKAKAFHNLGNTHLSQQKWEDAVKAYKQALKQNPNDKDTKYNLAYANAKLKEQQQSGGGQDNKNNKEKKEDKKDQQQNQDKKEGDKDKKDQQQADNQKQKSEQDKQQGQQPKLSKEEAEKMLQALQNEEQKTNQKMQQKQVKAAAVKIEKDW